MINIKDGTINVKEARPCPYCGSIKLGLDTYNTRVWLDEFHARVRCTDCQSTGPEAVTYSRGAYTDDDDYHDIIEKCIELYNTRK